LRALRISRLGLSIFAAIAKAACFQKIFSRRPSISTKIVPNLACAVDALLLNRL
jgi:hypothetical protein